MTCKHGYNGFCIDELSAEERTNFWALYSHAYNYAELNTELGDYWGDVYAIEYAEQNYQHPDDAPSHASEAQQARILDLQGV